jgi:dephospho-CoA kinase
MILIGLTGILGSGKSTVTGLLKRRGLPVIDLDALARDSLNWKDTQQSIMDSFGSEFVFDGTVNVEKLRQTAFVDRKTKERLESIIHPWVENRVHEILEELRKSGVKTVIVDHPLLIEVGFCEKIDRIVVVTAQMGVIRGRLQQRGMETDDIERRLAFQIPLEEKEKVADWIVDNNGTEDQLGEQVDSLLEKITTWEESRKCI